MEFWTKLSRGHFVSRIGKWGSQNATVKQTRFVDLAPTDKADEIGVYAEALRYATGNPRVSNIALTGPYGSGKSSVIKSFLKKYDRPVLQISLAAFLPEATSAVGSVSKQEIERSILQQMLYGADANRLPLSRFKRIQSPGKSAIFVSLCIFIGLLSCFYLFKNSPSIISGKFFLPFSTENWPNFAAFVIGCAFLWALLHHLYVASFGVSLKSISLKDIELSPVAISQDSILNRHLDEIIYFFQSTKYDLVVVEDLDRFNNSDIFVTLREINALINANSGVKRTIRFLYALRDDMFVNVDRTKFFEFIIPVIPIINSSNSIDKVLEQGKRLSLDDRLDRQFIREVSRYLNDLRLIQNIFNEYAIYMENLKFSDEEILNPNKLLAVLIYKNVFPQDFENLHRGKGHLAQILNRRDDLIARAEREYRSQIAALESDIANARRQMPSDLRELRRLYGMALMEKLPELTTHVGLEGQGLIDVRSLTTNEAFDDIITAPRVMYRNVHGQQPRADISAIQSEVNPTRTYQQRKEDIQRKSVEFASEVAKSIGELRAKISSLRTAKFNEMIRLSSSELEDYFLGFGDSGELAKFLVFEGYLDDTYYQYTSLFHSGRLSPADNRFLIQIRGFVNPEPDLRIDNPKEVIAAMREEDFGQRYVLNIKIVDCLLGDPSAYRLQTAKLFTLLAADFTSCEPFLTAYYTSGAAVPTLLEGLANDWRGFIPAALDSARSLSHAAQIIACLPPPSLDALSIEHPALSEFVSTRLPELLGSGIDFEPYRLKLLDVELERLSAVEGFPGVARFLFEEGLYKVNLDNVAFIFRTFLGLDEPKFLHSGNYTAIRGAANAALTAKIESDFEGYFRNVLLRTEGISNESVPAILDVLSRQELALGDLGFFLEKQAAVIPSLDELPTRVRSLAFQLAKVAPSWENCIRFIASEEFDSDILTTYLGTDVVRVELLTNDVPDGEEAAPLRQFIIENDALEDSVYRAYVQALPKRFPKFPETMGAGKLAILIEARRVTLSVENLESLEGYSELQLRLVATNIGQFLGSKIRFSVDDDFRERLLSTDITDQHKLEVVRSMDIALIAGIPTRAGIVGNILDRTGTDLTVFDAETLRAFIVNARPINVQISLLNKCRNGLKNDDVRQILAVLPEPYSEISTGYHIPRLKNSDENAELVKWLDAREIISSWSPGFLTGDIRINLKRR